MGNNLRHNRMASPNNRMVNRNSLMASLHSLMGNHSSHMGSHRLHHMDNHNITRDRAMVDMFVGRSTKICN